jgi:hypothetical protein
MKRSTILSWLAAHGGQKPQGGMDVDYIDVPNPAYSEAPVATGPNGTMLPSAAAASQPRTIKRRAITWTANDGERLRVFDDTLRPTEDPPDPNQEFVPHDDQGRLEGPGVMSQAPDPEYEFVDHPKPEHDPNQPLQTPYQAAQEQHALEESQANAAPGGTGNFETNAARDARLERENAAARAKRDQEIQEGNVTRQQTIDQRAAEQQASIRKARRVPETWESLRGT